MEQNETDILIKMNKTIGEVVGEVRGVNKRLDRINGTIIDHDKRIDQNTGIINNFLGKISVVGSIGVFLGGLIVAAINYFLRK